MDRQPQDSPAAPVKEPSQLQLEAQPERLDTSVRAGDNSLGSILRAGANAVSRGWGNRQASWDKLSAWADAALRTPEAPQQPPSKRKQGD